MRLVAGVVGASILAAGAPLGAQTRTEPADMRCPSVLGVGVATEVAFCDVLVQRDPAQGIIVVVPPHRGTATLAFTLHNRHTFSEDEIQRGRAYAEYTAIVAIVMPDGQLLSRGVVRSEFRSERDLVDRVAGGAGPEGVKAIAPIGAERISVTIPASAKEIVIVGERLDVVRSDRQDAVVAPGRAIAVVSDAQITYRPR